MSCMAWTHNNILNCLSQYKFTTVASPILVDLKLQHSCMNMALFKACVRTGHIITIKNWTTHLQNIGTIGIYTGIRYLFVDRRLRANLSTLRGNL